MGSEVARLMAQITSDYEAAQQGLSGLAQGTSQHAFITARMESMSRHMDKLSEIGGENAVNLILDKLADVPQSQI